MDMAIALVHVLAEDLRQADAVQVLIASPGKGMLSERIKLASELWNANIPTEFGIEKENPNFRDQLDKADNEGIPFVVVLGESELAKVSLRLPSTPLWS